MLCKDWNNFSVWLHYNTFIIKENVHKEHRLTKKPYKLVKPNNAGRLSKQSIVNC